MEAERDLVQTDAHAAELFDFGAERSAHRVDLHKTRVSLSLHACVSNG